MNKSTYLKDAEVKKFALWLGANLDDATLAHTWTDRRTGAPWSCRSAFDAFQQYAWRFPSLPLQGIASGTSFAASAAALASLRTALLNAVSDSDAQQAAAAVMLWGGVGPGNIRWLQVNAAGLLAMLKATAHAIAWNNLLHPILTARSLRFNAGMSKVYSLAVPGMIIYDSRVAAPLALSVTRYCTANGLATVPPELSFPVAQAKQSPGMINPKCRNPSRGPLEFPSLASGPFHAAWNLKASWLLEEALRAAGTASQFNNASLNGGDALRALEAALFMIGYDLPGYCAATASPAKPRPKPRPRVGPGARRGVTCYTLARKTLFTYDLSPDRLQIEGQAAYDTAVLQRVVDALWQSFGSTSFPLGNARDRVADGSAAAGFGTTFTAITGRSAQLASRLAAALVDIGVLCLVDESPVLLALVSLPGTRSAVALPSGLDVEASFARSSEEDSEQ